MGQQTLQQDWQDTISRSALKAAGSKIVKIGSKQIAIFERGGEIYACNNRCPHEGYPLKEGTLSDQCTLTCNWHNWKFNLRTGDNAYGGDRLRIYPVRVDGDMVQVDVADEPADVRITRALENLEDSFDDHEYDRMAREIARMEKAGGDALDAVRHTIKWTHDRFEFGMGSTHAPAAAVEWLRIRENHASDTATRFMPIHEIVAHFAWDCQREPVYPFPTGSLPWDESGFLNAIENEDEGRAIAMVRGALANGLAWPDLERTFAHAALAHYQDFGHDTIYTQKTGELIELLGSSIVEPVLLMLTRGLIIASREDLIPEFRTYADALEQWDAKKDKKVTAEDFFGLSAKKAMALAARAALKPEDLYHVLLQVNARSLLRFDLSIQSATDKSIAFNRTWLDVTHEITFANAAHRLAQKYPELWPSALLQMCCFFGRNADAHDASIQLSDWHVDNPEEFMAETIASLFDHGQFEYIVSAHLVKTATAVQDEIAQNPEAPWGPTLLAGLNRFLHSPFKRRHPLRTARQAMSFVAIED